MVNEIKCKRTKLDIPGNVCCGTRLDESTSCDDNAWVEGCKYSKLENSEKYWITDEPTISKKTFSALPRKQN